MVRGLSLVLIVALLACGCTKKDSASQAQAVEAQPAPAAPAESNTPILPATSEPPVLLMLHQFLYAVAAGDYSRALSLTIPGDINQQTLDGMHQAFQWDQATFTQAWADAEQAAVVCSVPIKQVSATWTFAFNLVAVADGRWLVRLADQLKSPQEVEDYLAAFREVAPGAKSIELQN
jgi:hypothetical protein